MTILDEILENKRREVAEAKRVVPPDVMAEQAASCGQTLRGFRAALVAGAPPVVIAEVKQRSPSKGEIREDFEPVACARAYEAGGAAALSVLTDREFFGGELAHLAAIREAVALPILRKDFIVDAYQIDEARAGGADAVLLIVAALSREELGGLRKYASERGLDTLVEVHDEGALEIALDAGADLVGVNNRNLHTFETDLAVTERLARRLPQPAGDGLVLVAESGIHTPADLRRLSDVGARGFLVGESLMRENDLERAVRRLRRMK